MKKASRILDLDANQVSIKVFADKATGVRDKTRAYGGILAFKSIGRDGSIVEKDITQLVDLQRTILEENQDFTRVFYMIAERETSKPYAVVIRAVETEDFLTARVSDLPWKVLKEAAEAILEECPDVSEVYYDVTPKPPATIEME